MPQPWLSICRVDGRSLHHAWAERYPGRLAQPYSAQQMFHRFQAAFRSRCISYSGRGCCTPELPAPVPAAMTPPSALARSAYGTAGTRAASWTAATPQPPCPRPWLPAWIPPHLLQHTVVLCSFRGRTMTARPAVQPAPRNTLRRSALASSVGAANFCSPFPAGGSLLAPTPMTIVWVGRPCTCACKCSQLPCEEDIVFMRLKWYGGLRVDDCPERQIHSSTWQLCT